VLLDRVSWKDGRPRGDAFPFSVPTIAAFDELRFECPVTFFVGENGSGKSTLLEALAIASGRIAIGSDSPGSDPTLAAQRSLARELRLSWKRKTREGFFLRSEDFFGYLRSAARLEARLRRERDEAQLGSDYVPEIDRYNTRHADEDAAREWLDVLDVRSHGESFLDLFVDRVRGGGLFLLDEPEAALSPSRQIALLSLIIDASRAGAQFIIATHSPILLACPGAAILSFDQVPIARVQYEELEHVSVTRDFLNHPGRYIRHLIPGESSGATE
jgi:predicted ATPase